MKSKIIIFSINITHFIYKHYNLKYITHLNIHKNLTFDNQFIIIKMVTTRTGDKKESNEPKKGSVSKKTNEIVLKATGTLFDSTFDGLLKDAISIYIENIAEYEKKVDDAVGTLFDSIFDNLMEDVVSTAVCQKKKISGFKKIYFAKIGQLDSFTN